MIDTSSIALPLIHELWSNHEHACPYVRHDDKGCYCTKPGLPPGGDPFMVCDVYSIQVKHRPILRGSARPLATERTAGLTVGLGHCTRTHETDCSDRLRTDGQELKIGYSVQQAGETRKEST